MNGIAYPVVREGDDEIAQLRAQVQQSLGNRVNNPGRPPQLAGGTLD